MLPADLLTAEAEALAALQQALASSPAGRWTVEFRFEGLRLLPLVLRLNRALPAAGQELRLLFADMGATALARRDAGADGANISSFGDQEHLQVDAPSDGLLLLVGASQADYDQVERICGAHRGPVVLLNPNLEDASVGIGSVARQRRRGFLSQWQAAYALIPQSDSALRRAFPGEWELYRLDPDGFRFVAGFERKPDGEQQQLAISGGQSLGIGGNLKALGDLIEGLQN
ncbi:MAG: DUF1995 family protein [Cyanobium sp.]